MKSYRDLKTDINKKKILVRRTNNNIGKTKIRPILVADYQKNIACVSPRLIKKL